MSEESDRMLSLLQELAALKSGEVRFPDQPRIAWKRRMEIRKEIKDLAAEKKQVDGDKA